MKIKKLTKFDKLITLLDQHEGYLFFNRNSDKSMTVWIRQANWSLGHAMLKAIAKVGYIATEFEIDKLSSNLRIKVLKVYK